MALITDTEFSTWQAHYVAKTLWTDEQFRRPSESARCVTAYAFQRRRAEDCESAHAARRTAELEIVSFVRVGTEKKQASGVVEALASATYHAHKMGRDRAEFSDIEWVLAHVHGYL